MIVVKQTLHLLLSQWVTIAMRARTSKTEMGSSASLANR